jgi:hypothetical protein
VVDAGFLRDIEAQVSPADTLVVIYTSGSTAEPRGRRAHARSLVRHAFQRRRLRRRHLSADDRIWSPMPFFWVGGITMSVLAAMHVGACLLARRPFDARRRSTSSARASDIAPAGRTTEGDGGPRELPERDLTSLRAGFAELLPVERDPPTRRSRRTRSA